MQINQFIEAMRQRLKLERHHRTEVERRVAVEAERDFHAGISVVTLAIGTGFHVVCLITDRFLAAPAVLSLLVYGHMYFLMAAAAAYLMHRRQSRAFLPWVVAQMVLCSMLYAYAGYLGCVTQHRPVVDAIMTYLGVSMVTTVLLPLPLGRAGLIVLVFDVAGAIMVGAGSGEVALGTRWIFMQALSLLSALGIQRYMVVQSVRAALSELKTMLQMAPAHIVAHAVIDKEPLEEAFRPERRPCACVSINWSDYESLAYRLSDARLAELLDAYYLLIDRLLEECITGGAYYCDVMVGEMLVVVFDSVGQDSAKALGEAFAFCRRLLRERARADDPALRLSRIDIGVSGGEALIGIMGPEQHRKTTGLGELPGRAGRLKGAAATLRRAQGSADRIVLDIASAALLGQGAGLERFVIPAGMQVRDLDEPELYFWEHAA